MKNNYFFRYYLLLFVLTLFFAFGCQKNDNLNPAALDLSQSWKTSNPSETGVDILAIHEAVNKVASLDRFLSLLVVKDGMLIIEEYFNDNHPDRLNDVRSVTKSVTSTLTGIALENGFIKSLDETIGDYLHPSVTEIPENKRKISIRHLLNMSSGLQWDEFTNDSYNQWITSGDHINYLFDLPLINEPGDSFTYNSGTSHLLGVVLEVATGMELEAFADQYLFSKIGVSRSNWENLPDGHVNGGSGIDLLPRDLARLGQFYLQEGKNGKEQILSKNWIEEATTPEFYMPWTYGPFQSISYGRLWWMEEDLPDSAFFAWGYGGQFIYVVPSLGLVVVSTTDWQGLSQEGGPRPLTEAALNAISEIALSFR